MQLQRDAQDGADGQQDDKPQADAVSDRVIEPGGAIPRQHDDEHGPRQPPPDHRAARRRCGEVLLRKAAAGGQRPRPRDRFPGRSTRRRDLRPRLRRIAGHGLPRGRGRRGDGGQALADR